MHAENEFRFLIECFGFTPKYMVKEDTSYPERSVEKVLYTSKDIMVEVSYSERGEIDVTIDENPPSHRFELFLFLNAFYPEAEKKLEETLNYGIASSDEGVKKVLKQLSDVLQQYGKPILQHDKQAFDEMKAFKWNS